MMRHLVFVAAGGALGAVARFVMSNLVHAVAPGRVPLATLGVNVLGSFLIGVLYVLIAERGILHADWKSVAMVGFLGAFTTFSTFSLETVTLLEHGFVGQAAAYTAASVCLCIGAAWLAILLARVIWTG
jgi:CrcB protein